jgi:hypothetical protein
MLRDTTDLTRRMTTKHLVMRKGRLATALLIGVTLASSVVTAAVASRLT